MGVLLMRQSRKSNSNLFAIDYGAIETTLKDANARLLKRRDDLLAAFSRAPDPLALDEDINRARHFAKQLEEAIREASKARLSDGRPFRDASATVKAFFDEIEKPLKKTLQAILKRLTDAAHQSHSAPSTSPVPTSTPVAIDTSGEIIATAELRLPSQSGSQHAEIRLTWEIEGYDRAGLNLEALRKYLTDAAILAACRKHLADHGPHKLDGVVYREVAQP
jgi:hypothetical protein